jgi:FMN phosphatase YigB (HAD superfamily)
MIKAVFLDVDDCVIPFWRWKQLAFEESVKVMKGITPDVTHSVQELLDMLNKFAEADNFESSTWIDTLYRRAVGRPPTDNEIQAIVVKYRQVRDALLNPLPGTEGVLVDLCRRGVYLGIITDAERDKQTQRLETAGISHFFPSELIVTSTDTGGMSKPSPVPYEMAIAKLEKYTGKKFEPHEILMIGDNYYKDVQGARKVGWNTAWVLTAGRVSEEEIAEVEVNDQQVLIIKEHLSELLKHPGLPEKKYA